MPRNRRFFLASINLWTLILFPPNSFSSEGQDAKGKDCRHFLTPVEYLHKVEVPQKIAQSSRSIKVEPINVEKSLFGTLLYTPKKWTASSRLKLRFFTGKYLWGWMTQRTKQFQPHLRRYFQANVSGQDSDPDTAAYHTLNILHNRGKWSGGFAQPIHRGSVEPMSKIQASRSKYQKFPEQRAEIGRDIFDESGNIIKIDKLKLDFMVNVSGTSFPSIQPLAKLTLLYSHIKLAKNGVYTFMNTGEGGPNLELALLEGNRDALKESVLSWGQYTDQLPDGSYAQAKEEAYIDFLMNERDRVFSEFTQEDLERTQLIVQIGTGLHGVRGKAGDIDLKLVEKLSKSPFVAAWEVKLGQVVKRGGMISKTRVTPMVAAFRHNLSNGEKDIKSPARNEEYGNFHNLLVLMKAIKQVSRKPVSLKLKIGQARDIYSLMEYARDFDVVPDLIQVDGQGDFIGGGSGHTPPPGTMGNSGLTSSAATIVINTALKALGIRDQIYVTISGENILPMQMIEKMFLGANGVAWARGSMVASLNCTQARICDQNSCPMGIAINGDTIKGLSFDPMERGENSYRALIKIRNTLMLMLGETGSFDWRTFHQGFGLHLGGEDLRKRGSDMFQWTFQEYFDRKKIDSILKGVFTPEEIDKWVYDYYPEEAINYAIQDYWREQEKYLRARATLAPDRQNDVEDFISHRKEELIKYLQVKRLPREVFRFTRENIPYDLFPTGVSR